MHHHFSPDWLKEGVKNLRLSTFKVEVKAVFAYQQAFVIDKVGLWHSTSLLSLGKQVSEIAILPKGIVAPLRSYLDVVRIYFYYHIQSIIEPILLGLIEKLRKSLFTKIQFLPVCPVFGYLHLFFIICIGSLPASIDIFSGNSGVIVSVRLVAGPHRPGHAVFLPRGIGVIFVLFCLVGIIRIMMSMVHLPAGPDLFNSEVKSAVASRYIDFQKKYFRGVIGRRYATNIISSLLPGEMNFL